MRAGAGWRGGPIGVVWALVVNPVATMREIGKKLGVPCGAGSRAGCRPCCRQSSVQSSVSCTWEAVRVWRRRSTELAWSRHTAHRSASRVSRKVFEPRSFGFANWCCNNVTTTVCGAICTHVDSEFPRRTTCAWGLITGYMKPVLKSRVAVLAGSVVGGAGGGLLLLLVDPNAPAALFFQSAAW